jgi:hypothetical protein
MRVRSVGCRCIRILLTCGCGCVHVILLIFNNPADRGPAEGIHRGSTEGQEGIHRGSTGGQEALEGD